jgi:hypothetical protein
MGFGQGLFEIAMAGLGIAIITLLIRNSAQTVQVTRAVGGTYIDILDTLTGQPLSNRYGGYY